MRLFLSAFIAFLIVFPVAMIKSAIDANPKKRENERREFKKIAIERGHVVTAELIKIQTFSNRSSYSINSFETVGIYEYFYNGKRYKYHFRSDNPKETLTLYFVDNPRKATVDTALKRETKISWPVKYLIVVTVIFLLMSL